VGKVGQPLDVGQLVVRDAEPAEPPRDATIPALTAPPRDDAAGFLTIAALERRVIAEALQRTHGHKARAAALLGLTRFQLYSRLKRYHIEVAGWRGAEQV
jgi:transcriptional regulator with GAF, ATPase, and Fis domain